jgi:hypothetical protein
MVDRRLFILTTGLAPLAACSGRTREERLQAASTAPDPRPLVPQVTRLAVEPHPAGAIIRVTGLPPRQGWYDGRLVRVDSAEAGVLAYQLRAWPPPYQTPAATPRSRELMVAAFVNQDLLSGVREVRVAGELNTLSSRR